MPGGRPERWLLRRMPWLSVAAAEEGRDRAALNGGNVDVVGPSRIRFQRYDWLWLRHCDLLPEVYWPGCGDVADDDLTKGQSWPLIYLVDRWDFISLFCSDHNNKKKGER